MIKVFNGQKLRQLRKDNNLSTQQVANIIGISQSYVSRFENNKAIPDVDMLASILVVYNTSISDFFSDSESHHDIQELLDTSKKLSPQQIKLVTQMLKSFIT